MHDAFACSAADATAAPRRGYDPTSGLPVLAGRVVESAGASNRSRWDYGRTLSDLIAENHYNLHAFKQREPGRVVQLVFEEFEDAVAVAKREGKKQGPTGHSREPAAKHEAGGPPFCPTGANSFGGL